MTGEFTGYLVPKEYLEEVAAAIADLYRPSVLMEGPPVPDEAKIVPPPQFSNLQLENLFRHHPPECDEQAAQYAKTRTRLENLAQQLNRELPDGRDKAMVITALEQAMFHANAAVARDTEGWASRNGVVLEKTDENVYRRPTDEELAAHPLTNEKWEQLDDGKLRAKDPVTGNDVLILPAPPDGEFAGKLRLIMPGGYSTIAKKVLGSEDDVVLFQASDTPEGRAGLVSNAAGLAIIRQRLES